MAAFNGGIAHRLVIPRGGNMRHWICSRMHLYKTLPSSAPKAD